MSRPIPFNTVQTFFWANVGEKPDWFTNDDAPVDTCLLPSLERGLEWVQRRHDAGAVYRRAIAPDASGTMFWIREHGDPIRLNAFGNPDFVSTMSSY